MKATYVVAAASVLTVAAGQLSSIPPCAVRRPLSLSLLRWLSLALVLSRAPVFPGLTRPQMQCFVSALGSDGCPIADQKCHCSQPGLQGKITPCVAASCSAADQASESPSASGSTQPRSS